MQEGRKEEDRGKEEGEKEEGGKEEGVRKDYRTNHGLADTFAEPCKILHCIIQGSLPVIIRWSSSSLRRFIDVSFFVNARG